MQFQYQKVVDNVAKCLVIENKIQTKQFVMILENLMELIKLASSLLGLALEDIQVKNEIILNNQEKFQTDDLIQQFKLEIELGIIKCNGENNYEFTDNQQEMYKSSGVQVLILMRFIDFLIMTYELLINEQQLTCTQVFQQAYKNTMGKHHPWVIQILAEQVMNCCPYRSEMIRIMGDDQGMRSTQEALKKLNKILYQYYTDNDLLEIA